MLHVHLDAASRQQGCMSLTSNLRPLISDPIAPWKISNPYVAIFYSPRR